MRRWGMHYGGVLPEDAMAQACALPVPARTLVAQPTLARIPHPSLMSIGEWPEASSASVSWSYSLCRVPGEPDHPANLADLDDATRAALDEEPPWPRPAWLVASLEWMRRPVLWEVVRTTWDPQPFADDPLADALRQHVAYVAVNRFAEQRGPDARWDRPELEAADAWSPVEVLVDGAPVDGMRLHGDPHVLGLGAVLADGAILTAALPRAELVHVRIAFETVAW